MTLKNEKKRLKAQCRIDRDKALAAIDIDHDEDQHLIEKVIEAQILARKLEESAVKGAQKVLKETSGTSTAATQVGISEAAGPPPVIRTSVSLPDKSVTGISSEATASEAAGPSPVIRTSVSLPEKSVTGITSAAAASETAVSDVLKTSKVTQSPVPPPSTSPSSSTDSDLDNAPLS